MRTCPSHGDFVFAPERGNVVLQARRTASLSRCSPSLSSTCAPNRCSPAPAPTVSRRYLRAAKADKVDHERFASKLWGDSYLNASSRTFQLRPPTSDAPRSFRGVHPGARVQDLDVCVGRGSGRREAHAGPVQSIPEVFTVLLGRKAAAAHRHQRILRHLGRFRVRCCSALALSHRRRSKTRLQVRACDAR